MKRMRVYDVITPRIHGVPLYRGASIAAASMADVYRGQVAPAGAPADLTPRALDALRVGAQLRQRYHDTDGVDTSLLVACALGDVAPANDPRDIPPRGGVMYAIDTDEGLICAAIQIACGPIHSAIRAGGGAVDLMRSMDAAARRLTAQMLSGYSGDQLARATMSSGDLYDVISVALVTLGEYRHQRIDAGDILDYAIERANRSQLRQDIDEMLRYDAAAVDVTREAYTATYRAVNSYVDGWKKRYEVEESLTVTYTEDGHVIRDIVAVGDAMGAIIRGGDAWIPTGGDEEAAARSAEIGEAIRGAIRAACSGRSSGRQESRRSYEIIAAQIGEGRGIAAAATAAGLKSETTKNRLNKLRYHIAAAKDNYPHVAAILADVDARQIAEQEQRAAFIRREARRERDRQARLEAWEAARALSAATLELERVGVIVREAREAVNAPGVDEVAALREAYRLAVADYQRAVDLDRADGCTSVAPADVASPLLQDLGQLWIRWQELAAQYQSVQVAQRRKEAKAGEVIHPTSAEVAEAAAAYWARWGEYSAGHDWAVAGGERTKAARARMIEAGHNYVQAMSRSGLEAMREYAAYTRYQYRRAVDEYGRYTGADEVGRSELLRLWTTATDAAAAYDAYVERLPAERAAVYDRAQEAYRAALERYRVAASRAVHARLAIR